MLEGLGAAKLKSSLVEGRINVRRKNGIENLLEAGYKPALEWLLEGERLQWGGNVRGLEISSSISTSRPHPYLFGARKIPTIE